jgi:hypothetical protein
MYWTYIVGLSLALFTLHRGWSWRCRLALFTVELIGWCIYNRLQVGQSVSTAVGAGLGDALVRGSVVLVVVLVCIVCIVGMMMVNYGNNRDKEARRRAKEWELQKGAVPDAPHAYSTREDHPGNL